ncbi:hypothetical protein C0993_012432, partial [Termitomyces sp. T159_Od127]
MTISKETKLTNSPAMGPLGAEQIAEMKRVDSSSNLTMLQLERLITANWIGHILDKDNEKWSEWSYSMTLELSMAQLWEYVYNAPDTSHSIFEPCAHHAWINNNCALSPFKQKLCTKEWDPVKLWKYLKDRH